MRRPGIDSKNVELDGLAVHVEELESQVAEV